MDLEREHWCPLIGEECMKLKCEWFTQVRGMNPQTGKEVDEWGCAVTWLPMLLIENSQKQIQTGAAVESFRNEIVKRIIPDPPQQRTIEMTDNPPSLPDK